MPYALFSLRSLPLEGHGFTPFDLVHGFRQRTPLEAIYHNLVEQHHEQQQLMVSEWVDRMASTLEEVREIAAAQRRERGSTTSMQRPENLRKEIWCGIASQGFMISLVRVGMDHLRLLRGKVRSLTKLGGKGKLEVRRQSTSIT